MSAWLIGLVAVIYALIAVDNFIGGDNPHGAMWSAYALANVALLWYELEKG